MAAAAAYFLDYKEFLVKIVSIPSIYMYFIVGMVQTLNSYLAPMIYMLVFDPLYIE